MFLIFQYMYTHIFQYLCTRVWKTTRIETYTDTSITRVRVKFSIRDFQSNPTPIKHDTYAKERNKINTGRICLTFELETLSYIIPYIPYKHTRAKGSSTRSKSFCNAIHFTLYRPRRTLRASIPKDHFSFVVQSIKRLIG